MDVAKGTAALPSQAGSPDDTRTAVRRRLLNRPLSEVEQRQQAIPFVRQHLTAILLWAAAGLIVLAFLVWAVRIGPRVLTEPVPSNADLAKLTPNERVTSEINFANAGNQVRTTLIQAVGGAALLTTAFFAWRQIAVSRFGQMTDRFAKAVTNLESAKSAVRLGGVYTLEQLSRDDRFSRSVAHLLLAFIRQSAERPANDWRADSALASPVPVTARVEADAQGATKEMSGDLQTTAGPDAGPEYVSHEMQEALNILVLKGLWPRVVTTPIDMSELRLRGADLPRANLRRAVLSGTDLTLADLRDADLTDADLRQVDASQAYLQNAVMPKSRWEGATLRNAQLVSATADDSRLAGADLTGAELTSAGFTYCDFTNARLTGVKASGIDLTSAILEGVDLKDGDLQDATLTGVNFRNADLRYANFTGARMADVTLDGAQTTGAKGLPSPGVPAMRAESERSLPRPQPQ